MDLERLGQLTRQSQHKQQETASLKDNFKKAEIEQQSAIFQLKEQLEKLKEDQRVRNAQEQLPILVEIAAHQGKEEARVFRIDFDDTKGDFIFPETFKPELPGNLIGAGKIFFDWLVEQGVNPSIKGERQDYF